MPPKNWTDTFIYSPESIPIGIHPSIIKGFLASEDQTKIVPCLEEKRVHPNLHIVKITPDHKTKTGKTHPLASIHSKKGHEERGIFAHSAIATGTILGEYVGEINMKHPSTEQKKYCWMAQINKVIFHIDAESVANEMVFVNDYRNIREAPNCLGKWVTHRGFYHFVYETTQDIDAGDEVLVNYGEIWEIFMEQQKKTPPKGE